jgi:hypothetical protein
MAKRPRTFQDLSIFGAREIDRGKYKLFGMECPTEVMAAYERLIIGVRVQDNGDVLVGWAVATALTKGDFELASALRDVLERLGWQAQSPT